MFQFVEFLHSNIDNFAQYDGVFAETRELNSQRWRLNEHGSYAERRQYENLTAQISVNLDTIEEAVLSKIRQKAIELGVFDPNSPATVWNWNYPEIVKVKEEADDNDLGEILSTTGKYSAFREAGKYTDYLCMGFIFGDLDKLMIGELHNYFSEEKTAPPTVQVVNSLGDAISAFREGQTFVTIPFSAPIVERTETTASQKDIELKPMSEDHAPLPPWMDVGKGQIPSSLPAIKEIEDELRNRSTVREKLDYWVEAISKRIKEVSGTQHDLDFPTLTDEEERSILKNVFGGTVRLVSPVKIPDYIHLEHFSEWQSNAEYTNWFIPVKSKFWFDKLVEDNKAEEHINSALGADFIRGQLKLITDIENKADELLATGQINIDTDYREQPLIDVIEYLRIKGGYYQRHSISEIFFSNGTNPPLQAYAKHVYYKDYLNQASDKMQLPEKEAIPAKYAAKHFVLAYLFECNAIGVSYPMGKKSELEGIGNERLGPGKGNTFYKVFNQVIRKDINATQDLIEIGGENWRASVLSLSKHPNKVNEYLTIKGL